MSETGANDRPIVSIRPIAGWRGPDLRELWSYRELLLLLAGRDVKVRYQQTILGAGWAILQPFLTMLVFSVVLGGFAKVPSDGIPYPVFVYAALIPWQLFAHTLTESSNSLVANQHLITKVSFPRLVIPLVPALGGLVDFAIAFAILFAMMAYYHIRLTAAALVTPLFLLLTLLSALGVGTWLSALNVQYRDVRHATPFLAQLWLFATPIAYPSSLVPARWQLLYHLNPMAGVVEGFRWALLGTNTVPAAPLMASVMATSILLATGVLYFRRMEAKFADVV